MKSVEHWSRNMWYQYEKTNSLTIFWLTFNLLSFIVVIIRELNQMLDIRVIIDTQLISTWVLLFTGLVIQSVYQKYPKYWWVICFNTVP